MPDEEYKAALAERYRAAEGRRDEAVGEPKAVGLKQGGRSREGVEDEPRDETGKWTAGQHVEHIHKLADAGIKDMQAASEAHSKKSHTREGARQQAMAVAKAGEPHAEAVKGHVEKAKKSLHPKYHKQVDEAHAEVKDRFGSYMRAHM